MGHTAPRVGESFASRSALETAPEHSGGSPPSLASGPLFYDLIRRTNFRRDAPDGFVWAIVFARQSRA